MSEENQGGGEKKRNNNRNRNRNRNKNRNRKKSSGGSDNRSNSKGPNTGNGSKKKSNNKRRPRKRFKLSKEESIYNKYLTMMEQHLNARKKYFALFDRADPQQRIKLERNFTSTMNKVREFENSLEGEDLEKFQKRVNGLSFDSTYSQNHEISFEAEEVPTDLPAAEPHFLETQKASDFSDDTEESVGSMEDYLAYKGL